MADKQISDLTSASALDGTELVHIVQGGNSRKATVANISTAYISGEYSMGDTSTGAASASAYATKGQIVSADYDCKIRAVAFWVDADATATYKAVIAKLDGSNVITEILATSSVVAAPSPGKAVSFPFATAAQVASGDRIALMLVRTDGTSTSICETPFPASTWGLLNRFTLAFSYVGTVRYASTDPAVSDSVLYDTTSHIPCKVLC